jgi:hypothetical protein
MSGSPCERRVTCPGCRFMFNVSIHADDANSLLAPSAVEAQCPCCEAFWNFSLLSMEGDLVSASSLESVETKALSAKEKEILAPILRNSGHPVVSLFDRVGNGFFQDDCTTKLWPIPHTVYRFRKGILAAYIWPDSDRWLLRSWESTKEKDDVVRVATAESFEQGLDLLMEWISVL